MIKKCLYTLVLVATFTACKQKEKNTEIKMDAVETKTKAKTKVLGKTVEVYTTAEGTDKRLSSEAPKTFTEAQQPLETEVAIFVNPEKQFQEFLGIGGAITDASAEVFSQLSNDKQ